MAGPSSPLSRRLGDLVLVLPARDAILDPAVEEQVEKAHLGVRDLDLTGHVEARDHLAAGAGEPSGAHHVVADVRAVSPVAAVRVNGPQRDSGMR